MLNKAIVASTLTVCALLINGCQKQSLIVENEWVSERSLASYWVQTPDPNRFCPSTGRRLIVSWTVPREYLRMKELHIELTVRFGDNKEDFITIPVNSTMGRYTYSSLNENFWDHCGIETYRAQLVGNACILDEWKHALWAELIVFDDNDEELPSNHLEGVDEGIELLR